VFCLFAGVLDNLGRLSQQYGLSTKGANEVLLVIEAYKTLRDRAPYPASFMLAQLTGSYAFVLFDKSTNTLLVASVSLLSLKQWMDVQYRIIYGDSVYLFTSDSYRCDGICSLRILRARCRSSGGSLPTAASPSLMTLTCSKDHVANRLRLSHKVINARDLIKQLCDHVLACVLPSTKSLKVLLANNC